MTEILSKAVVELAADKIQETLPLDHGFILLVVREGVAGGVHYSSNIDRLSAIDILASMVEQLSNDHEFQALYTAEEKKCKN